MNQNHPIQKIKNLYHKFQSIQATQKYGDPAKKLKLIGVTGTDGKTTVSTMIYHVLKESGKNVGYISTINAKIGDSILDTGLHVTTPDPWDVPRYLKMMVDAGVEFAVLESTSSGLDQNRLYGIEFDASTITNIKYDHLDYHATWENYAKAKYRLVEMTKKDGKVVLNEDDSKSADWLRTELNDSKRAITWVGQKKLENASHTIDGIRFTYKGEQFELPIIGKHNFINTLQTIEICLKYVDIKEIVSALKKFNTPEGRMEIMQTRPFTVIVDFAHTPKALESALNSLLDITSPNSRIISVFGCAGKRDKGRREMGKVSAELADITILTAEDPRNEKLAKINSEIFGHSQKSGGKIVARFSDHQDYVDANLEKLKKSIEESLAQGQKPFITFDEDNIRSREDAVELSIKLAMDGDIVFITGKGHEKSLAFGEDEKEYGWSDQVQVKKVLSN